jgi:hypothetical protein
MGGGLNQDGSILFLSCDLQNSTQFKQKSASKEWIATFLAFYTEFPALLSTEIAGSCPSLQDRLLLWKAIGDELIFSVRIQSERECSDAVDVWLAAMLAFEKAHLLVKTPMTLKGGAFLATVPSPDRRVAIPRTVGRADRSQLDPEAMNESTLNEAIDEDEFTGRFAMDFVGPSIDTGFRVLKFASRRYFVLTAEVAHVLFKHYSDEVQGHRQAYLVGTHELKGVWGGRPYPVFALARELEKQTPAQALAESFGDSAVITDEYPHRKPHDVLAAIAEYRADGEWKGAIHAPEAHWAGFRTNAAVIETRAVLDGLIDTSEDPLDTADDEGNEDSPVGMPTN